MIIRNNKTKGQYLHYKVNGKNVKYFIPALTSANIIDLTNINQIVFNTYERRLRHLEVMHGKNFHTSFEVPGDPDYNY